MVKLLITHQSTPADPNKPDDIESPIQHAVRHNMIKIVRIMLTEARIPVDVKIVDGIQFTLLKSAVFNKSVPVAKLLLDAGADPNQLISSTTLSTALKTAVHMRDLNMCKLLVEYGGQMNATLETSALLEAVRCGVLDIVKYFVEEQGANILAFYGTAIRNSLRSSSPELVEYLFWNAYRLRGDGIWWYGSILHEAMGLNSNVLATACEAVIAVLLRWGVNSIPNNVSLPNDHYELDIPSCSVLRCAAETRCLTTMKQLKELYPSCMQEPWLVEKQPLVTIEDSSSTSSSASFSSSSSSSSSSTSSFCCNHPQCIAGLYEERKYPPRLKILCREIIFRHLGYNPMPKAEKLPLPRVLIGFVQGKDIQGLW